MPITVKAKGGRGVWSAKVDGEAIPCVHRHWLKGSDYNDVELRPTDPKHALFVEDVRRAEKVIVCNDEVTVAPGKPTEFKRKDYISLCSIENIEFDADGLRFNIVERLASVDRG